MSSNEERWVSCAEAATRIGKPGSRLLVRGWAVGGVVPSKMITPRRMEVWLPAVIKHFDSLPSAADVPSDTFDTFDGNDAKPIG